MIFLRVQSLGKAVVPSYDKPTWYFVSYGNPLFQTLLNLIFNENDLYQKLVKSAIIIVITIRIIMIMLNMLLKV